MGAEHKFRDDPHWRDLLLFYEYFHGDTGAGIGASHQTGWTGCVAPIIQVNALLTKELLLAPGAEAAVFRLMQAGGSRRRAEPQETHHEGATTRKNLPQPVMPSAAPALLKGQKALVTGANSGIGRAIALALGHAGADVVVNYVVRPEDGRGRGEEMRADGVGAMTPPADVSDEAQVQAMFAAAEQEFGTVDILVSNAGLQQDAAFQEMTLAQWDTGHQREPARPVPVLARGGPRIQAPRRGPEVSVPAGKIICISSVHEVIPWAGHVNYAASKGGLMLLMKSLAQEVAPAAHPRQQHLPRARSARRSTWRPGTRPRPTPS